MKIQSLSIVVPNKACINKCKFCVSRMRAEEYKNNLYDNLPFTDLYERDYITRMAFARDNGCNTVMLTGNSEPQQNEEFLKDFGRMNSLLEKPFRCIEMQTTGAKIDERMLRFLRNHVKLTTISLSISSFDDDKNNEIIGTNINTRINLKELCGLIKKYDFTLRLSLNLTDAFNTVKTEEFFSKAKELGADQLTFRVMYTSGDNEQSNWIREHQYDNKMLESIREYIETNGRFLETLEYGQKRYSVNELSTVLDDDCMSTIAKESLKYLILRPNCKLYSKWDDKGSLIF